MTNGAQTEAATLAQIAGTLRQMLWVMTEIRDRLPAPLRESEIDEESEPAGPEQDWLPTAQFCATIDRSRTTVLRWRREHDKLRELAPDVPSGQRLRWHRDAVPWLRQRGLI